MTSIRYKVAINLFTVGAPTTLSLTSQEYFTNTPFKPPLIAFPMARRNGQVYIQISHTYKGTKNRNPSSYTLIFWSFFSHSSHSNFSIGGSVVGTKPVTRISPFHHLLSQDQVGCGRFYSGWSFWLTIQASSICSITSHQSHKFRSYVNGFGHNNWAQMNNIICFPFPFIR